MAFIRVKFTVCRARAAWPMQRLNGCLALLLIDFDKGQKDDGNMMVFLSLLEFCTPRLSPWVAAGSSV
ncbi:hypothetical protein CYD26_04465 [Pseudomonas sp. FFUP_PS_473]|nr:hypothetical protein CS390_04395 [Pseudomonas sp. HLS-6]PLP95478.1 hypothetical protein CYD26_04465 [Pseudomonas sp. FFUP_PS_473]